MSFDRKIDQVCPHMVVNEGLFVNADRRTVRPVRPIASIASTSMRLNGEVEVPAIGVQLPARVVAPVKGRYYIQTGVNDRLIVRTAHDAADQVITAPTGRDITTQGLADSLNQSIQGAIFSVTRSGRLRLQTAQVGKGAELVFRTGSTLTTTLGLPVERFYRGQQTVPGWSIIHDPTSIQDRPHRLILFDETLHSGSDFVEINYATIRQECRRCNGLGIENDWRYGRKGDTVEVRDEALLIQELLKITYTIQGTNTFHRWYGTNLLSVIARKIADRGLLQSFVVRDIHEAFRRWQGIKKQQEEEVGQYVSDEEFPYRLLSVTLQQSDKDPTIMFVNAEVQNRSAKPLYIERGVRVPEPIDLLGSTAQQGVYRQSLSNFTLTG